ncbi:MAG: hypothetical protein AABY22_24810 [Nanoarchaeota archaeon]
MEAKRKYSSKIIQELAENNKWNFWASDWSKRIIVKWESEHRPDIKKFSKDVIKLVGRNFKYERALNNEPVQYEATLEGLKLLYGIDRTKKQR